jgi:hypothetical protein
MCLSILIFVLWHNFTLEGKFNFDPQKSNIFHTPHEGTINFSFLKKVAHRKNECRTTYNTNMIKVFVL